LHPASTAARTTKSSTFMVHLLVTHCDNKTFTPFSFSLPSFRSGT